jgi:hypothetical protein
MSEHFLTDKKGRCTRSSPWRISTKRLSNHMQTSTTERSPLGSDTCSASFVEFPKMARLSREVIITEKIDGTNAQLLIAELANDEPIPAHSLGVFDHGGKLHYMAAGSRTRWITPEVDNAGFAAWVARNFEQLKTLGPGRHFGEWWGQGIQRKYGMSEKRWSLFNVDRWCLHGETPQTIPTADPRIVKTQDMLPPCCHLVPVLHRGIFSTGIADAMLCDLAERGSKAAPGFMKPEGIVVFHVAGNVGFKKTLEKDEVPKGISSQNDGTLAAARRGPNPT